MSSGVVDTDRIEKHILLRAPRSRVWRAISNAAEFGSWFQADFGAATFAPGAAVRARITHPGYEGLTLEIWVERMEPERLFSFRWHPYDVNPDVDSSNEPKTLVVFELEEVAEGTRLTVVESGFDAIPVERRAEARRANDAGWAEQVRNIETYVARRP